MEGLGQPASRVPLPLAQKVSVSQPLPSDCCRQGPRELAVRARQTEGAASCPLRPPWADSMVFPSSW